MSKRSICILLALPLLAGSLASCGLRGDLERPAPIFGEARERYEAEQAQRAAEAARGDKPAPSPAAVPTPPPPRRPIASDPISAPTIDE